MKRSAAGALCFLIVSMTSLVAGGPGQGKSQKSEAPHARAVARETTSRETTVSVSTTTAREPVRQEASMHFSVEHVRAIKTYYAPRRSQLPPGLQKKYARTGQLPPGWQKKMEPLPATIERDLPRLPDGYRRGIIEGHAVVYSSRAGTIIDVAVLF